MSSFFPGQVGLKNRFEKEYKDAKSGGYRDLQMTVEVGWVMDQGLPKLLPVRLWDSTVSERHICEIQLHLKDIYHVKKDFHKLYIEWRNMLTI
ncbi:hypothetical protein T484DRAFT_1778891 [Baffinella frigidus]|nr:hypothetical protein T484DRAFT_1778891 [Cryptophyta sp. CCMP2293]